ncbi:MAG: RnfABCDGE type electron transport complex subunit D [Bacilli bacterium]
MGPFIKTKNTTNRMMINVLIALSPIILFTIYKNGYIPYGFSLKMFYPLIFVLTGGLSSLGFETLYQLLFKQKEKILKTHGLLPGIFLSLVLPINTPLSILIFGSFISIIIGKMLFGGFGKNIFNPALVGALVVISCYGSLINTNGGYLNKYELDTISKATPLTNADIITGIGTYEELVEPYGNLSNFFIGTIPGSVGETSSFLILLGFIYLVATKTIKWRIPAVYVSIVFLMSLGIGESLWYSLFMTLSGGLLFGAVFMATDPVTSPITTKGQIIYGLSLGFLTVTLRYLTPYPEAVLTSILTMNMLVFIIDKISFKKALVPLIILIILFTFIINNKMNIPKTDVDPNFNILNIEIKNNQYKYTVTQKGYSSLIKASITIEKDKVIKFEVLDQNDSFFKTVKDANYTDTLIKEQEKLNDIDTVSGATVSSTALKKMMVNTLEGYKNKNYVDFEGAKPDTKNYRLIKQTGNTFKIETDSFGGKLIANITIENNVVTNIELLDYKDNCISSDKQTEYYTCPTYLNEGYINNIKENNDIDSISGATISSNAIKKAIKGAMEEYNEGKN